MLAKVPGGLIFALLIVFGLIAFLAVVSCFVWMIRTFVKADKKAKISSSITLFVILVAAASWIFNMGWLRLIMTLFLVPFIHAAVLIAVSIIASKYYDISNKLTIFNTLFLFSYAVVYVCIPDFDDVKGYCLFSLVRENDLIMSICYVIMELALCLHIIMLVLIVIEIVRCKRKSKLGSEISGNGGTNEKA
ncbi:MAG: hypothetical protein J6E38_03660 [Clostridia bacterium]|nr:hypothetical protein [Clostridia bacterium]